MKVKIAINTTFIAPKSHMCGYVSYNTAIPTSKRDITMFPQVRDKMSMSRTLASSKPTVPLPTHTSQAVQNRAASPSSSSSSPSPSPPPSSPSSTVLPGPTDVPFAPSSGGFAPVNISRRTTSGSLRPRTAPHALKQDHRSKGEGNIYRCHDRTSSKSAKIQSYIVIIPIVSVNYDTVQIRVLNVKFP